MSDQKVFPFDYQDIELKEELKKLCASLRQRDSSSAQVDVPFVQLGIVELQSRDTLKVKNSLEAQSRTSWRFALASVIISVLSLLIAIGAFYIAKSSYVSSTKWEQNRLDVLNQILAVQKDSNKSLTNLNNLIIQRGPTKNVRGHDDAKEKQNKAR